MNEGEIRQLALLYSLIADMHATLVEVEGMKAENQQRAHLGQSMAYDDESFFQSSRNLQLTAAKMKEQI